MLTYTKKERDRLFESPSRLLKRLFFDLVDTALSERFLHFGRQIAMTASLDNDIVNLVSQSAHGADKRIGMCRLVDSLIPITMENVVGDVWQAIHRMQRRGLLQNVVQRSFR